VASPDGADDSVTIHQDARGHAAVLDAGQAVDYALAPERHAWVQVARGAITLNGRGLHEGDGAAVSGEPRLALTATEPAELLLFDLP
jgi:hypothetical protein